MSKETITKYKIHVPEIHGSDKHNGLIFDTLEEANKWLLLTGLMDKIKVEEVKGIMVTKIQPCSIGLGIYGRTAKVWEELKDEKI